ncbi:allantoinase AllB [Nesterenkonia flava]|uniref:allantoinase n=1 Tax=Nesterenkonia flava TaxID=469799 RepID=A0ABU1FW10_9MICC|nr:allantoinase AllB [Nesterenkonia flava]MDR5712517.1 allantoinase AllB [Nesterenkonia flava]
MSSPDDVVGGVSPADTAGEHSVNIPETADPYSEPMSVRHLIAEQVLIEGVLQPAHLEITDEGIIHRIEKIAPGTAAHRAAVCRSSDVGGGDGLKVLKPRMMVLPGVVDSHVHINEPGRTSWEGFATGTMAAALGGVTTVVDMPLNSIPSTVTVEALEIKRSVARSQAYVDIGFWGGIVPGNTDQLAPLWDEGVFGFKCFLLDSGVEEFPPVNPAQLREAMTEVARFDGLVIVHAEDARTIDTATQSTARTGSVTRYADWAATRPPEAETEAIRGLLEAVRETGCRTHILHLASAAALDLIREAKDEGLPLTVETCPHYLCFEAERIPDGAAEFKCCPPIRDAGNRDALWQGLQEGLIDVIVSDHSPSTAEEKYRGAPDLSRAWGGISGLQVGFAAVASEARRRGVGIEDVSRWMSGGTAALVGLDDRGEIAVGRRADFLFYDPAEAHVVSASGLAHKNPVSAYEGHEISGTVVGSVLAGTELFTALDSSSPLAPVGDLIMRPGAAASVGGLEQKAAAGPVSRS